MNAQKGLERRKDFSEVRSQQGNGVSHWQLSLAFPHYSIHKALSPPTRGRTVRLFLPRVLHPAERPMRAVRPIKTPNRTQLMLCDMAEDLSVYLLVCDPVWVGLIKQQFGSIMANVWNWYKVNWRIGQFKQIDARWNWCIDPFQLSPKPTIVLLNWRQRMKICVISKKFDSCHAAKYSVIDSAAENVLWEKENQRKDRGRGRNASRVVTDNTTLSKPIFTRPKNPWQSWEYQ